MAIELVVNGTAMTSEAEADTPLLWVLRDELGLTGTKYGCGIAQCGACTVLADGVPVPSCSITVADRSHPVQRAWAEVDVPQCGYCQSGQIMTATALLADTPDPNDDDIDAAMAGVLCRCGTYPRIRTAIKRAAELTRAG